MSILELHRLGKPLSMVERAALPPDCLSIDNDGEVIARWDGRGRTRTECLYVAAAMAKAVPSALFSVRDGPLEGEVPADPWAALEAGRLDGIDDALRGASLDGDQRWIVQQLFRSSNPAEVALACRIALVTDWRTAVTHIRRLVDHDTAVVRQSVAAALGALAGPVVEPMLNRLSKDQDPGVREAAQDALSAIRARQEER